MYRNVIGREFFRFVARFPVFIPRKIDISDTGRFRRGRVRGLGVAEDGRDRQQSCGKKGLHKGCPGAKPITVTMNPQLMISLYPARGFLLI